MSERHISAVIDLFCVARDKDDIELGFSSVVKSNTTHSNSRK